MTDNSLLPFDLPAVARKKVTVGFDGGRLSSDGGLLLLREAERKHGLARRLAACLRDRRDPARIEHSIEEMLKLRMLAIAAGYEDADDCDELRRPGLDPGSSLRVGRRPRPRQRRAALLAADHEPAREHALQDRSGTPDGGSRRPLL